MRFRGSCCTFTILLSAFSASAADRVRVNGGMLEGTQGSRAGIRAFLGIPYAAPPLGALRWRAPEPSAKWKGVRKADHFGNRCIQTDPFPDMVFQSSAESEDCLYLNIWTPARATSERLPVMVWIHGGGYTSGAGDEKRHDGSALASKGVVLVTINYRLGMLGFLAHPELTAESSHKASGNYGLMDQVAAIRWVHDNIAAFGGDPAKVTIFGESAGSESVSALMATPLASGLFRAAIGESGAHFGALNELDPLAKAERWGTQTAEAAGAKSLAELRSRPAASFGKTLVPDPKGYGPIVDGYVLPEDPQDAYAHGRQAHVPLLAGWNSAETKNFADKFLPDRSAAGLEAALRKQFPDDVDAAKKAWPAGDDRQTRLSAVALVSDNLIVYSTWKWIEVHTATGKTPVYRYLFDHVVPMATGDAASGDAASDDPGAAHATDIEFVFSTLDTLKLAWRDSDRRTAEIMSSYWSNFAKNLDPNGPGLPQWPVYRESTRQVMRLGPSPAVEPETNRARYELQDALAARSRSR